MAPRSRSQYSTPPHQTKQVTSFTSCFVLAQEALLQQALPGCNLVEMFNCIVDTVEDSSSVRSYRKFLIANFCYKYIHKTIKLTEHYNT